MRYLIKVTYMEGRHAGESYLMRKGGYVTDETEYHGNDDTYKTENIARSICRRLYKENESSRRAERRIMERRAKEGNPLPRNWFIYNKQTFEPYPVPADKYVNI